jgi:hypothetical protein
MDTVSAVFILLALVILLMGTILWIGWTLTVKSKRALSPYSKTPLRYASTIRYTTKFIVQKYLKDMEDYHNRVFNINDAAVDRENGMLFPDCVSWTGRIRVDWTFLQKRRPGNWVSWGSLPIDRQQDFFEKHGSLTDFQTEFSSPSPLPQNVEMEYVYIKPGPLYVNLENDEVMGWKIIPHTDLQVLVVKEPIKDY